MLAGQVGEEGEGGEEEEEGGEGGVMQFLSVKIVSSQEAVVVTVGEDEVVTGLYLQCVCGSFIGPSHPLRCTTVRTQRGEYTWWC